MKAGPLTIRPRLSAGRTDDRSYNNNQWLVDQITGLLQYLRELLDGQRFLNYVMDCLLRCYVSLRRHRNRSIRFSCGCHAERQLNQSIISLLIKTAHLLLLGLFEYYNKKQIREVFRSQQTCTVLDNPDGRMSPLMRSDENLCLKGLSFFFWPNVSWAPPSESKATGFGIPCTEKYQVSCLNGYSDTSQLKMLYYYTQYTTLVNPAWIVCFKHNLMNKEDLTND